MDDIVLVRHGESETAAAGLVGGDAGLSATGRAQALELAHSLWERPIDICFTSPAARALETAALALGEREVPRAILPDLADIDFGAFAGRPLEEYRAWIATRAPTEPPPEGESRLETLRRFCRAYRTLLERAETHVLVVAHGLTLTALTDDPPRPIVTGVPYGRSLQLTHAGFAKAVARLERWCKAPAW